MELNLHRITLIKRDVCLISYIHSCRITIFVQPETYKTNMSLVKPVTACEVMQLWGCGSSYRCSHVTKREHEHVSVSTVGPSVSVAARPPGEDHHRAPTLGRPPASHGRFTLAESQHLTPSLTLRWDINTALESLEGPRVAQEAILSYMHLINDR